MTIQLGIAPTLWLPTLGSNSARPEPGGNTPLSQCLREAGRAGYRGIEMGAKFPLDAAALRPLLDDHGLRLASGWFAGGLLDLTIDEEKKRIARRLELYQALDVPVMVYGETTRAVHRSFDMPLSRRPTLKVDDIRRYGEKLTRFAEWLETEQCRLSFHPHAATVIASEADIELLLENSDVAVGLVLDTGHLAFAGGDVDGSTRRWAKRINHIHVQDVRADLRERLKHRDWSYMQCVLEAVFTVPGDGSLDLHRFMEVIKDIDYAGWMIVEAEQDPARINPLEMAEKGMAGMRAAAASAGIEFAGGLP